MTNWINLRAKKIHDTHDCFDGKDIPKHALRNHVRVRVRVRFADIQNLMLCLQHNFHFSAMHLDFL